MPSELQRIGSRGETVVSRILRRAGYAVTRHPKSYGVFDLIAVKPGKVIAVQVKSRAAIRGAPLRPYALHKTLLDEPLPDGNACRLWWIYIPKREVHVVSEVIPTGFRPFDPVTIV